MLPARIGCLEGELDTFAADPLQAADDLLEWGDPNRQVNVLVADAWEDLVGERCWEQRCHGAESAGSDSAAPAEAVVGGAGELSAVGAAPAHAGGGRLDGVAVLECGVALDAVPVQLVGVRTGAQLLGDRRRDLPVGQHRAVRGDDLQPPGSRVVPGPGDDCRSRWPGRTGGRR